MTDEEGEVFFDRIDFQWDLFMRWARLRVERLGLEWDVGLIHYELVDGELEETGRTKAGPNYTERFAEWKAAGFPDLKDDADRAGELPLDEVLAETQWVLSDGRNW